MKISARVRLLLPGNIRAKYGGTCRKESIYYGSAQSTGGSSDQYSHAILIVVSQALPRLRLGLDFIPSSDPEHPGLLIRDPLKFSDAMLLIPPQLVECLACFDGEQSSLDLRANLVRITGEIQIGELEKHLSDTLSQAGFLEDEAFEVQRLARVNEFIAAPTREAAHAGSAYPDNADEARKTIAEFMQGGLPA